MKSKSWLLVLLAISFFSCNNSEEPKKEIPSADSKTIKEKYLSDSELLTYISKVKPFEIRAISDTIIYNKVIAYDFDGREEAYMSPINGNWSDSEWISFSKVILKQKSLTETQIATVEDFLFDNSTYGNIFAACFEPHLGVVFYEDFKVKCVINICLDCNSLSSSTVISATSYNVNEAGVELKGFSKLGRTKIIELSSQLNFKYNKLNTSICFPNQSIH